MCIIGIYWWNEAYVRQAIPISVTHQWFLHPILIHIHSKLKHVSVPSSRSFPKIAIGMWLFYAIRKHGTSTTWRKTEWSDHAEQLLLWFHIFLFCRRRITLFCVCKYTAPCRFLPNAIVKLNHLNNWTCRIRRKTCAEHDFEVNNNMLPIIVSIYRRTFSVSHRWASKKIVHLNAPVPRDSGRSAIKKYVLHNAYTRYTNICFRIVNGNNDWKQLA